ncbi:hypothetical protein PR202_gb02664 [Eleusine coracana subsp. coracana]|uniref:DUF599 domain-containing protein n=1 Tax=Eleusine coracana subsp. coracana TaxID=191504 RepID=A0AAV5DZR8_ELECO|nr:hypothetical protein QOZ80_8BG0665830 [Eleusine coracana subsp. coracana]GJN15726.1 hypothetical protein PR202_gb02664 [Eleusine coracana subsp. coracana]
MAWKDGYLDVVLIPLAVLFPIIYHVWLWRAVRRHPLRSTVGINTTTRRLWVFSMMKDNEKKAVLVVQSVRNVLMGSTLVGTTSILFCTGVAAVLSSTYAVKKPLSEAAFGAHGETVTALKYVVLLSTFLLAFLCHSLAICTLNQATFLVNALSPPPPDAAAAALLRIPAITRDYVADVLERGFMLNFAGNRLFFAGAPLLLWIFGPVLPCICSMAMIPMLYSIDMVERAEKRNGEADAKVDVIESDDPSMQV